MDDLIYDRTQTDVDTGTAKGYYNYTDLNRIESWCQYIADLLTEYSYSVSITVKTNWTMADFPTQSNMERIRQNVLTLKNAYYSLTQVPSNLENMTYEKANKIEKILYEINRLLPQMENEFIYCGVSRSGQNRVWQQRFRRMNTYYSDKTWEDLDEVYWLDFPENQTWIGVDFIAKDN